MKRPKNVQTILYTLFIPLLLLGCTTATQQTNSPPTATLEAEPEPIETTPPASIPLGANVLSVMVSGEPGGYQFSVEISSPDEGCQQYADWWEVLNEQGELIYRRILTHSHVNEQPFVRSGGPVSIEADTVVWVRAHMHPGGYGGTAFKGSAQAGFQEMELSPDFAAGLAETPPLPGGCGF